MTDIYQSYSDFVKVLDGGNTGSPTGRWLLSANLTVKGGGKMAYWLLSR